jgi:hypothetical protein
LIREDVETICCNGDRCGELRSVRFANCMYRAKDINPPRKGSSNPRNKILKSETEENQSAHHTRVRDPNHPSTNFWLVNSVVTFDIRVCEEIVYNQW